MKIIITEQQLNKLINNSKFLKLLIKYLYEPTRKYPFYLWNIYKHVKNWPNVTYTDENNQKRTESLDLENNQILKLTKDKLVFYAGGDWQPEFTVTVKLIDGKLSVTDCRPYNNKIDGKNKPSKYELLKLIGMEDDYKQNQKEIKQKSYNDKIDKFVKEYNQWNNGGYKKPSEKSVLEFFQNNNEDYNQDKKLQKDVLNKLKYIYENYYN